MGLAVTALFTQYDTRKAEIDHQTFVLGCRRATTEETAAELAKGTWGLGGSTVDDVLLTGNL